ncbi:putative transcriptional regulator [Enterococcus sp. PF1-24]|uniref:BlaI/MecI/CopY family transcriptional regulator n=1 Tax=unclassified Enterococcus TaxID=2608891 RepID=UPI002473E9AC|nr:MULTISPECIES: BlaI/MecI/CopY family transcriptional regulator [unclassified Enterococcus]MDH6363362.1 putative transcriptional regulator [Enterococcus sp. PFB1-1]MDH6400337.1 putative transcriptional regulator [Enterococcus sp. PF1-24]
MVKKDKSYFFLTEKEEATMKVLWENDKPMSAAEIAEEIPNRTWPATSIQGIIKKLEKKNAIKVAKITKIGKAYGRLFVPTISANEYATMQFKRFYQEEKSDSLYALSALLGESQQDKEELIKNLQDLIKGYEEEA